MLDYYFYPWNKQVKCPNVIKKRIERPEKRFDIHKKKYIETPEVSFEFLRLFILCFHWLVLYQRNSARLDLANSVVDVSTSLPSSVIMSEHFSCYDSYQVIFDEVDIKDIQFNLRGIKINFI